MKKYLILKCTNMTTADRDIPLCYFEYTSMTLPQRLHFHFYHTELDEPVQTIHKAIKALGTNIFKWEIIDETTDEQEAQDLVRYYIHEYQSDVIGYNENLDPNYTGENNPRWNDHRTWEEIHGKEKAEQLKQQWSEQRKGSPILKKHLEKRLEVWNPMNDPAVVEKCAKTKRGANNPRAEYDYIFTKGETTFSVPCLATFCRQENEFTENGVKAALSRGTNYKGWMVKKVKKVDRGENKE